MLSLMNIFLSPKTELNCGHYFKNRKYVRSNDGLRLLNSEGMNE